MKRNTAPTAMLMTAGLGTRLQPFTKRKTKALLPVLGIPSAQYAIESLARAGVKKIAANVHHLASDTRSCLSQMNRFGAEIALTDESRLLLGTAGGIQNAMKHLGEGPFFRANADVLCDLDWEELWDHHQKLRRDHGVTLTLAIYPQGPNQAAYPEILVDEEEDLILGIGKPQINHPFWIGAAVIEREAMALVPPTGPSEFVPWVLNPAIQQRKAGVFLTSGTWYDIGSPDLWLQTHLELIQKLETGQFSNPELQVWEKRIREINVRLGSGIWVHHSLKNRGAVLQGPCYLGILDQASDLLSQEVPHLGSNSVLYGNLPFGHGSGNPLQSGIGYGGYWVP